MDTDTDFTRTVSAAIGETQSKFALAEALALDIALRRGRPPKGETPTDLLLAQARTEIIMAGGEPRSVKTLTNYRLTALWVRNQKTGMFQWLRDRSWSSHDEARQNGLTYAQFAAMPRSRVIVIRDVARENRENRNGSSPAQENSDSHPEDGSGIAYPVVPVSFLPPVPPQVPQPRPPADDRPERKAPEERKPPQERRAPEGKTTLTRLRAIRKLVEQVAAEASLNGVPERERAEVLDELDWLAAALNQMADQVRKL